MNTINCQKQFQALKEQAINAGFRGNFNVACFARMPEINPQAWVNAAQQIAAECQANQKPQSYAPTAPFAVQRVRFW